MREEFSEYMDSIGMTTVLHDRVEAIYEFYRSICPGEIVDIFVTDYIKEDGSREYEDLLLFSEKHLMEAKGFITKDDFGINPIRKRVEYCRITKRDYDLKKATEKSRLYAFLDLGGKLIAEFKASKENCDYLRDIIHKHVIPNLQE